MNLPSRRECIAAQLADLKLPGALQALDRVLSGVDGAGTTASEAIERLLAAPIALRNSRRLKAALRSSRLGTIQTLSELDFSFQPSIQREPIDSLHELGFAERRENIVLLGPPGGQDASGQQPGDCGRGAWAAVRFNHRLKTLTHPALLVVDEIGSLPVSQGGAVLLFQLVNRR